jgi:hypothetical protein
MRKFHLGRCTAIKIDVDFDPTIALAAFWSLF